MGPINQFMRKKLKTSRRFKIKITSGTYLWNELDPDGEIRHASGP